jgi:CspA family cold shock protein
MTKGKVKWFDATKGYGFIQPDDVSKDVFVRVSSRARWDALANRGTKVSFDVVANPKNGKASADNLRAVRCVTWAGRSTALSVWRQ